MKTTKRLTKAYTQKIFAVVDSSDEGYCAFWLMLCCKAVRMKSGGVGLCGRELFKLRDRDIFKAAEKALDPYDNSEADIRDVTDLFQRSTGSSSRWRCCSLSELTHRCGGALFMAYEKEAHKESFDARKEDNKGFMNNVLYQQVLKLGNVATLKALVLDAQDHRTTTTLRHAGLQDCNIHIPNFTKGIYTILTEKLPQVRVQLASVGEALMQHKDPFDLVYLDYCCTFKGSESISPQDDLVSFFKNNLLSERVVLAYTFCKRDPKKKKNTPRDSDKAWQWLQHHALNNGYLCKCIEPLDYGNMFSYAFKLEKLTTKPQSAWFREL